MQRTIAALADTVVVHEPSFARVVPGAEVVPHGDRGRPSAATARPRAPRSASTASASSASASSRPYKGLEAALGAARLAGEDVELVIAGGEHPRLAGDGYARRAARRGAAPTRASAGYVADADVARWFAAADVALLPYPRPFASSGPLALALAHGTPVLLSDALAGTRRRAGRAAVPTDPAAIAARLDALAADRADRERLRAAAATLAAGRSWPEVARRHLDLYRSPG